MLKGCGTDDTIKRVTMRPVQRRRDHTDSRRDGEEPPTLLSCNVDKPWKMSRHLRPFA